MGQIDPGALEQTAAMARLRVDPDEREELIAELERIVEYFALLAEADVDDSAGLAYIARANNNQCMRF